MRRFLVPLIMAALSILSFGLWIFGPALRAGQCGSPYAAIVAVPACAPVSMSPLLFYASLVFLVIALTLFFDRLLDISAARLIAH